MISDELTEMKVNEFNLRPCFGCTCSGRRFCFCSGWRNGRWSFQMVAALTLGKPKYAEYEEKVQQIFDRADKLTKELVNGIDRDTEAFDGVSAVFAMPKSN